MKLLFIKTIITEIKFPSAILTYDKVTTIKKICCLRHR